VLVLVSRCTARAVIEREMMDGMTRKRDMTREGKRKPPVVGGFI
jgi:hypothetical protein